MRAVVLGVLACLLAACPAPGDGSHRRRALIIARPNDALTLDPAAITDNESMQVATQIYETLVRYRSGTTEVEPALATHWTVGDNGRTWTFRLRRGVYFHDGTRFSADAVVASFERQRDRKHRFHFQRYPYWENTFSYIKRVEKLDAYRVRIHLEEPHAPFLASLAMFPVSIVSPSALAKSKRELAARPVGTGAYRFERWDRGQRIVMRRFARYWGKAATIERLVYRVMPDPHQRLDALQSGTVDVVTDVAPEDRPLVALHPELILRRVAGNNVAYLAMNTARPRFADVRVRRAVNHAIDKQALVKLVYQGLAVEARGPIPPGLWGFTTASQTYDYDPKRARALLREASFDHMRPIRLLVMRDPRPYVPTPVLVGRMVARYLHDVGLRVELVARPHGEHLAAVRRGKHDICLMGWVGDSGDPDNFLFVLFDKASTRVGNAQNVAFFKDERVHRLLVRARRVRARGERKRLYLAAQRIIAQRAPWVPLAHTQIVVAHRRRVKGLRVEQSNAILYRNVSF